MINNLRIVLFFLCGIFFTGLFYPQISGANEVKQYDIPIDSGASEVFLSVSFVPQQISAGNSVYDSIANATGGQTVRLSRSETSVPGEYIRMLTQSNVSLVLHANDKLIGSAPRNIILTTPSGNVVTPNDKNTLIKQFSTGQYMTIKAPQPGVWHLQVSGQGGYSAVAHVQSPLFLYGTKFISRIGLPTGPHLYQKIEEEKNWQAGAETTLQIKMSGVDVNNTSSPMVELVTSTGKTIQRYEVREVHQAKDETELLVKVKIPNQPFRFQVVGVDKNKMKYQRINESLYTPK